MNTDGFTIGEQREIHAGMRIFELAKQTPSMRHYIWSNIDYFLKVTPLFYAFYPTLRAIAKAGGFDDNYHCEHCGESSHSQCHS